MQSQPWGGFQSGQTYLERKTRAFGFEQNFCGCTPNRGPPWGGAEGGFGAEEEFFIWNQPL